MPENDYHQILKVQQSISIDAAAKLSTTVNTIPQIPFLSPRWLLRFLPWVNVETGIYRINQISYLQETQKVKFTNKENLVPDLLRAIPLFKTLSDEVLEEILQNLKKKEVAAKDVIIKEGSVEEEFYIILDGDFDVIVPGRNDRTLVIKTLSEGDYFGEIALLEKVPRQATVVATTKGKLLYLNKKTFDRLVKDPNVRKMLRNILEQRRKELQLASQYGEVQAPVISGHTGEPPLPRGYTDYKLDPREIHLSVIQTIIDIHTRISDVYNIPYNQLEQQLRVTIENIREREEWEIINNKEFGLLHTAADVMTLKTRTGPPTPDDLDELISLVWKKPAFFVAHPKAIAAFGRECTFRGVPPVIMDIFGSRFLTWRGLPLVPCNKMMVKQAGNCLTTDILLMRVGEEDQGVVGLHKADVGGSQNVQSLSVHFTGINERSIASYLVTKYFSVAALVPDALGVLKSVEIGNYHNYE